MNAYVCTRCGHYWTTNCGARDSFSVVSKYCPDCIELTLPVMGRLVTSSGAGMVAV